MQSYIENLYKKLAPVKYSYESELLLQNICNYMKDGNTVWNSNNGHIEFMYRPPSAVSRGVHYDSIPEKMREEIATFGKLYEAKFLIGERQISIFIYSHGVIRKGVLRTYLKKLYIWLYIACNFAVMNKCSRVLNIYIYMTKMKKRFPQNKGEVLGIPHVNSGFTYSCAPKNEIHVYREEEWFKVVIHETFHSLHLDFSSMDDKTANALIYNIIPIHLDLRFYEAYTDGWSDIIHTCFVAKGSFHRFKELMEVERKFSIYQCGRVLHYYGLTYMDLLGGSKGLYKENSPVLSYYIIKSCFHFFLSDFLYWCAIKNRGSIQFRHIENNIKSLCDFYRELYRKEHYMGALNMTRVVLDKEIPKLMENTLRRTIL
jgi:hypothetical protein